MGQGKLPKGDSKMKKLLSMLLVVSLVLCLIPIKTNMAIAASNSITVTFNANAPGGKINSQASSLRVTIKTNSTSATQADFNSVKATFGSYIFIGWYSNATLTSNSVEVTAANIRNYNGKTIYAHWVQNPSSISFDGNGGTVKREFQCTAGHTWYNLGSWITISGMQSVNIPGTTLAKVSFNVTVPSVSNANLFERYYTLSFYDRLKKYCYLSVSQSNYAGVYARINGVFYGKRKYDNKTGEPGMSDYNKYPLYNLGYACLFEGYYDGNTGRWKEDGTCCTDSAMMDLLNRRLAREGKVSQYFFFDIRDVFTGMNPGWDREALSLKGSTKDPCFSQVVKHNMKGHEICNAAGSAYFTNTYGSHYYSADAVTYKVKFVAGKNNASQNKTTITDLLRKHPEGVFVYASYPGKQHAVLITGYINGQLYYIDNGRGYGDDGLTQQKINELSTPYTFNGLSTRDKYTDEEDFLKQIITIGYVE